MEPVTARDTSYPPRGQRDDECPWAPIMAIYCVYAIITFLGALTGNNLQIVGAVTFLAFITIQYGRYVFPLPLSGLTLALAVSGSIPLLTLMIGSATWGEASLGYLVKYSALLLLILIFTSLRLPPLFRARTRSWGLWTTVGILVLGLGLSGGGAGARLNGIFINPNNFALAALSILFFVDHERDSRWFIVLMHALVITLILLSGTTGALLGYCVGLYVVVARTRYAVIAHSVLVTLALLLTLFMLASQHLNPDVFARMGLLGKMMMKAYVMQSVYTEMFSDAKINYWQIGQQYGGAESTSAVWRIMHWRDTLAAWGNASPLVLLLGFGVGSSEIIMGILPHNDYLRFLFEVGVLGLLTNGMIWWLLFRAAQPSIRWVCAIIAAYCFTENNLDNFLVMSLFVLFITSASTRIAAGTPAWRQSVTAKQPVS